MLANLMNDTEKNSSAEEPTEVEVEEGRKEEPEGLQNDTSTDKAEETGNTIPEEDKERGSISILTYLRYFREGAWIIFLCFTAILFVLTQVQVNSCSIPFGKCP